jgi:hypothetical protein
MRTLRTDLRFVPGARRLAPLAVWRDGILMVGKVVSCSRACGVKSDPAVCGTAQEGAAYPHAVKPDIMVFRMMFENDPNAATCWRAAFPAGAGCRRPPPELTPQSN